MNGPCCTEQNRSDGDVVTCGYFQQVIGDVRSIDVRQNEKIGISFESTLGNHFAAQSAVQGYVTMHFTVDVQVGHALSKNGKNIAHLLCT